MFQNHLFSSLQGPIPTGVNGHKNILKARNSINPTRQLNVVPSSNNPGKHRQYTWYRQVLAKQIKARALRCARKHIFRTCLSLLGCFKPLF